MPNEQRSEFTWPPTAEAMASNLVVDVSGDALEREPTNDNRSRADIDARVGDVGLADGEFAPAVLSAGVTPLERLLGRPVVSLRDAADRLRCRSSLSREAGTMIASLVVLTVLAVTAFRYIDQHAPGVRLMGWLLNAPLGTSADQPPSEATVNANVTGTGGTATASRDLEKPARSARRTASGAKRRGFSAVVGGLLIDTPIQVLVYENGRFVGASTDGPLRLKNGPHRLVLVNEALHYGADVEVQIRPRSVTSIVPELPEGAVNINARPWSEVFIDGTRVGETPLGRVVLSIGPHRIVFRHPTLGERTRTVVVAAGTTLRVTADLERAGPGNDEAR